MSQDLAWMIDDITVVAGVRHVLVLSSDGLVVARSPTLHRDDAERLAATCAGLHSLGRNMGREFGSGAGTVRQIVIDFDGGLLMVKAAGEGSRLAVVTSGNADPGLVAQKMQEHINQFGRYLNAPARAGSHG